MLCNWWGFFGWGEDGNCADRNIIRPHQFLAKSWKLVALKWWFLMKSQSFKRLLDGIVSNICGCLLWRVHRQLFQQPNRIPRITPPKTNMTIEKQGHAAVSGPVDSMHFLKCIFFVLWTLTVLCWLSYFGKHQNSVYFPILLLDFVEFPLCFWIPGSQAPAASGFFFYVVFNVLISLAVVSFIKIAPQPREPILDKHNAKCRSITYVFSMHVVCACVRACEER